MHFVPVVPSEIDQFFNAFRHMSLAQQQQQLKALRDTHHEYIADLESRRGQPVNPASPSLVENTQGSGSSSSGAHHVPPTGVEYWAAMAGDDRNLVGRRKGNLQTPGASHRGFYPRPIRQWVCLNFGIAQHRHQYYK